MNINADMMKALTRFAPRGVVSAASMQAIDKNADAYVPAAQRMEAAGAALADEIRAESADSVLFVCGAGNNGGDGLCAARHLAGEMEVSVCLPQAPKTPDAAAQLHALRGTEVRLCSDFPNEAPGIVVDCLLGTGARTPLNEPYASLVSKINASGARIISADIPTPGVLANKTVAFHLAKSEGAVVRKIGIPLAAEIFCGDGDLLLVPKKPAASHKGAGGSVLIIGGGPYQGAPFLAGMAALRAGADLVRVATPAPAANAAAFAPDLIIEKLEGAVIGREHEEKLCALASAADCVVAGPGLGTAPESLAAAASAVACAKKAVVDADLLRSPLPRARDITLYTPHAGEFARCFGEVPPDLARRGIAVRAAAGDAVILLKGKEDVIADGMRVKFNTSGCAAMTVGGTGDVLSGLCGGLMCRMPAFEAACAAAYALGKAGEAAAGEVGEGLAASDLLKKIAGILYHCHT
ncbi:MAG TPA: NAD(P)H-hydrate dehydratase [Methanocorpusculum sp.]|nr:NAD(P)H-hydrate dehydratase [Methanocorpusculum sp.]